MKNCFKDWSQSSVNVHADVSSGVKGLKFCPSLHLYPYFVYANSEGFGESVHTDSPEHSLLAMR